jgi:V8-like Glu-specific endopeptidase
MSDHEVVSSSDWSEEELELHAAVSSENPTAEGVNQPESGDDIEEDGFDVANHGGGELESVPSFDSGYVFTEGFDVTEEAGEEDLSLLPPAWEGEYNEPESVCGDDNRTQITNTTSVPWRMICKLVMTKANGTKAVGTGWFIGPRTVMTAGHCVYGRSSGGWMKNIEVIPGCNGSSRPFGSQVGTSFRSVNGWIRDGKATHDYGCIILPNDNLGRQVGWFGFASLSDNSLKNLLVNNSGYPADKNREKPCTQWFNAGRLTKVEARQLFYLIDTFGGQSGSPTWRYRDGKRHAVGVHAYGGCPNKSTRIIKPMYDNMIKWKNV